MVDTRFYKNKGPFSLGQIEEFCEVQLADASQKDVKVFNLEPMTSATANDICCFYDKKSKEKAAQITARACITTEELAPFVAKDVVVLIAKNPKLAFLKLVEAFYEEASFARKISDKASIHHSAKVGANCYVGDFVSIGENVIIGDDCIIEPNAVIGRNCQIGNACKIGANASISFSIIGNNCYIFAGARVGQDGFGFMMINGQHKRILQVGRVIIGNDVEVGACTCIDRGALDDTIIGDGTRIDNFVQIAHGVKIGKGCILVAQAGLAGSCTFGDYVVCGGQVGIADHINIGTGAQIGSQSGIMRDVNAGDVLLGTPAVLFKDFMRQTAYLQKMANPKK